MLALKKGTETQTKLSGKPFNYDFCPQDDYYLKAHLFGDIFAGDQLSASDREIVTVAALASIKGIAPQLAAHQKGAVNMGNTQEQVDELMRFLSDKGLSQCDNAAEATAGAWPKGNPNTAFAKFFIGNSHLARIAPKNLKEGEQTVLPMSNVTFEPGCRNNGTSIMVLARFSSAYRARDGIRNGASLPSPSTQAMSSTFPKA